MCYVIAKLWDYVTFSTDIKQGSYVSKMYYEDAA